MRPDDLLLSVALHESLQLPKQQPQVGPRGLKGDRGIPGERGERGEKGERGRTGTAGLRGPQGERGEHGKPGLRGEIGPPGERGEKGERGADGAAGKRGPKGEKGAHGRGVHRFKINKATGHLWVYYTDGAEEDIGRVVGPMGPEGPAGRRGGGRTLKNRITVTSDYTTTDTDDIVNADATTGDLTITLQPSGARNREIIIKRTNASGGAVTVVTPDNAEIEGQSYRVINRQYWSLRLYELDGAWWEY